MQRNTRISIPSFLALIFVLLLTEGCKIQITVPESGKVVSASHAYDCDSGKTCVVEVNDFYFAETFDAHADEGWIFIGWKFGPGFLCGRSESVCHLSNKGLGQFDTISAIVESDETFYLEPEFVKGTPFDEALAKVQDENLKACLSRVPAPKRYAEQISYLSCGNPLYPIVSDSVGSVQGIEAFAGIESLDLIGNSSLTDLQPMGKLSRLKRLSLYLPSSFNAAPLGELKLLNFLYLITSDLTGMSNLKSLKELYLRANSPDLSGIGSLKSLRILRLGSNRIRDIGPLAGLTKLETLQLGSNGITDISSLAGMTNLKDLSLERNQVSDIGPLAGLTQLQSLELNSNPIRNISRLAELKHLRSLELAGTGISDIAPLAGLTQLEDLMLNFNNIEDISPLAGLTNLKNIDAHSNQISDLSPLAGLKQLKKLGLGYNFVTDIVPLAELPEVLYLDFQSNRITTVIDTLDTLPSLQLLSLAGNPIACAELVAISQSRKYPVGLSRDQISSCDIH